MKKALLVLLVACLLGLAVGCSSQPAKKDYGPPKDIKLSSEEIECQGVHVRVPDSLKIEQSELGEYHSVTYTNEPITGEVAFSMYFESADALSDNGSYGDTVTKKYTPEEAMIMIGQSGSNEYWTNEPMRIGGTSAKISRGKEGDYESTRITLVLNTGLLTIRYGDRGGRYGDLIQESIDSIRVDEELIPDIVRITSPEGLKDAGLYEQPWEITCDPYGIYVNMPEDFTLVKRDDGSYVWVSSDGQTMVSSTIVSMDFLLLGEEEMEYVISNNMPLDGFDYFHQGSVRGMYCTELKYKQPGSDAWAYVLAVLPWKYGKEAIMITVVSYDEDEVELQEVMDTLRFADGINNGGVLDLDAIAVPA